MFDLALNHRRKTVSSCLASWDFGGRTKRSWKYGNFSPRAMFIGQLSTGHSKVRQEGVGANLFHGYSDVRGCGPWCFGSVWPHTESQQAATWLWKVCHNVFCHDFLWENYF